MCEIYYERNNGYAFDLRLTHNSIRAIPCELIA